MKNIIENPQNISELLKAKVESFQVEELDSRLEMRPWVDVACHPPVPDIPPGGVPPTFPQEN
jgi:hypothetical protein